MKITHERVQQTIQEAKEKHLKKLDLSGLDLTEIPAEVFELEWLDVLIIMDNYLTQIPEIITRLQNLTSLDLSRNKLTQIPETITQLQNLTSLNLSYNYLTQIPATITHLKNLISLDLSGNGLTQIPATITHLKNLTSLALSDNGLKQIPATITHLQNLISLDLSYNYLTQIPETITHLQNLTFLALSGNQIAQIPETITHLKNLTSLALSGNYLTQIPKTITSLKNLTSLALSSNGLTQIPATIMRLQNLTSLALSGNQIAHIPETITRLKNLTSLDLCCNKLTQIPATITQLQNLTSLDLSSNYLTQIPETITRLQNLTSLNLSGNYLTQIPETIMRLQNLTSLALSGNQIAHIPETITRLKNLTSLALSYNPIEKPPLEVVVKGIDAIRDYFRQLKAEGTDYLYEAKLLIVGEGGAGKTTLAKKIEDENYQLKEEDATKGIEVIQWYFEIKNGQNFQVNIWDFGGQEIYHATHQFFLTKRSLYAVVADNRKEDTNFYYWLNLVELLSDNSPVLIIKNEKQDQTREINEPQLRGRFSNLKETLATNLATNQGLPDVLREIKHHIYSLPHIGVALPKTWVRVREALENDARNYISLDEYLQICQTHGFTQQKDKLQLSNYLHDLGVCLHFQDDPILNKIVILKPKWGTDAVYKVLDDKEVINNLGKFTWRDLQNIWEKEQYAAKQGELLQLMINFKLCYKIPNKPRNYIAPQLLTEKQPDYSWDETNNLILRYTYDFMPKGIITQFIVATHQLIDEQKYVWKSGVILSRDETRAEVIEYYDQREIKIRVSGLHKRDLLTCVTHELDKIHDAYNQLKFNKLIPCNCSVCKNQQNPHFYKFDNLRNRITKQKYDVECDISFEKVNVLQLIDDVMDRNQLNQEEEQREYNNVTHIYNQINANTLKLQQGNNIMNQPPDNEEKSKPQEEVKLSFAFINGMFYLFIGVVFFCMMTFFGGKLPFHYLVLIILGTAIFIILIGILQLRQDDRLSETSFVKLIKMVLKQFPLIGNFIEMFQRK